MALNVKDHIRAELVAARQLVADDVRCAETAEIVAHLLAILQRGDAVAAYAPLSTEPGFPELADTVVTVCGEVLLPIARRSADGIPLPLQWSAYRSGPLMRAPNGLFEPGPPWLPPSALGTARTVLVPALAVDRRGVRLGRGAGYYDRSLSFRNPDARLIAVVRDEELLDALPVEPHDVAMTHALTPQKGLIALG
ncbi:MAG TPA: 5-formyltetrahydrofolate cyclo-ligase [Mycobacterium sp.]